ncbi:high mobility group box domain-containing protein [Gilbertella persicaria]|uniref:high mobility group box domain-containing protein n=1 Tax=Gilbertella persicaria TaxID=101096 RepID=UPI0022211B1F|nr:high mobility group box domain-containing protein [Gilbertella persicaria]KAI8086899.1 high mobility group box domain-containing protein [Gilbertella persicaria]
MVDNKASDRARAATIIKELGKNLHDFTEILLKLATETAQGTSTQTSVKTEEHTEPKKKKEKDPNAPKRNLSSYMLYSQEVRPSIVAKHPDLKAVDIAKLIGEMWNGLSDKEKQPYVKSAEKEKARFDKENEKYKASLSGQSSTPAPAADTASSKRKADVPEKAETEKSKKSEKKKKKSESKEEATESSPKKKAKKNK